MKIADHAAISLKIEHNTLNSKSKQAVEIFRNQSRFSLLLYSSFMSSASFSMCSHVPPVLEILVRQPKFSPTSPQGIQVLRKRYQQQHNGRIRC
jgi:hypothetical protein